MATFITGSVGQGGQNRPEDVRTVCTLFNNILPTPLTISDHTSPELIHAAGVDKQLNSILPGNEIHLFF